MNDITDPEDSIFMEILDAIKDKDTATDMEDTLELIKRIFLLRRNNTIGNRQFSYLLSKMKDQESREELSAEFLDIDMMDPGHIDDPEPEEESINGVPLEILPQYENALDVRYNHDVARLAPFAAARSLMQEAMSIIFQNTPTSDLSDDELSIIMHNTNYSFDVESIELLYLDDDNLTEIIKVISHIVLFLTRLKPDNVYCKYDIENISDSTITVVSDVVLQLFDILEDDDVPAADVLFSILFVSLTIAYNHGISYASMYHLLFDILGDLVVIVDDDYDGS